MKNYVRLATRSPFSCQYLYLDTADYIADKVFIDNKLRVHFGKEYVRGEDRRYRIIHAKFSKRRESDFIKCMEELCNRIMLIEPNAYKKYKDICDEVIAQLNRNRDNDI